MDQLTIDIVKTGVYTPEHKAIVIRHEYGEVILFIDGKRVALRTVTAVEIGLLILKAQLEIDESFEVKINNKTLKLLVPDARKLAAGLLRKADDADDWQMRKRNDRTTIYSSNRVASPNSR